MSRVGIFIDGGYLDNILRKEFSQVSIDYDRFATTIAAGREIFRTYYYDCPPYRSFQPTPDENLRYSKREKFHKALNRLSRFEVRLGRLARRPSADGGFTYQQKRVDVLLAVDLVRHAAQRVIQYAVIVGGDSDFVPAVRVAKEEGVLVSLYHGQTGGPPHGTVSDELFDLCDERIRITKDLIDACARKSDARRE